MRPRLSLGPLTLGLLSVLLLLGAAPDTRLHDTTATVVLETPQVLGTTSTVVVQVPSAGAPVLLVRHLDRGFAGLAREAPVLRAGSVLRGRQVPGDAGSFVLDGQTAPTPLAVVLLAVGLGLLLLRQALLLMHRAGAGGGSGRPLQDVHAAG
jgi:hypothetical protein